MALSATAANAQIVGTFNGAGSLLATGLPGLGQPVTLSFVSPLIAVPALNGIFAPIPVASLGTVQTITVGSGAYNVPNFIQIAGYNFSLLNVAPPTFSAAQCLLPEAPGQVCGAPGTPFDLANVSNGVGGINSSASFSVSGIVSTPSAQNYGYTGIFTAQFSGQSYQDLVAAIDAGQALPVSYSLNIVAEVIPEPATFVLMGSGLLLLAGAVRRRTQA